MKNGNKPEKLENRLLRDFCCCPSFRSFTCVKRSSLWTVFVSGVKDWFRKGVSFSFEESSWFSGLCFRGVLAFNCQDRHIIIFKSVLNLFLL